MQQISTPDLCDAHDGEVRVLEPMLRDFGGLASFYGEVVTVKCFEDNSVVKEQAATPGKGRVMVVDGGGSRRRALLGDMIAGRALENNWAGFVIYGSIRDVEVIATLELGVKALDAIPVKTEKRGLGDLNVPVRFGGVTFSPGDWVYADRNGIIVADQAL